MRLTIRTFRPLEQVYTLAGGKQLTAQRLMERPVARRAPRRVKRRARKRRRR
jgi:hypothetical protein